MDLWYAFMHGNDSLRVPIHHVLVDHQLGVLDYVGCGGEALLEGSSLSIVTCFQTRHSAYVSWVGGIERSCKGAAPIACETSSSIDHVAPRV